MGEIGQQTYAGTFPSCLLAICPVGGYCLLLYGNSTIALGQAVKLTRTPRERKPGSPGLRSANQTQPCGARASFKDDSTGTANRINRLTHYYHHCYYLTC